MSHRTLRTRALAAAALLMVGALASAPAALAAAKDAAITGTVVNGTSGKQAAGIAVTLHLFSQQAELTPLKATTDVRGSFSFPQPSVDAQGYQVSADYKGGHYQTTMAALTPGKPLDVKLTVYETTADPAKVSQSSWIVWVDRAGSQGCTAGACVQHDIQWTNGGDAAYAGDKTGTGGSPVVTSVPLAAGATNFQFLGTYLDAPGQVQGSTYVNPQPIVPGTTGATLRYDVASLTRLTLPVTLPTTSFELYVPPGVVVKADRLTASGQVTDQGVTYQRFAARNLRAGDTIDATLSGFASGSKRSPLLLGVLAGLIVMVIGGLALWTIARRNGAARRSPGRRSLAGRKATASRPEQTRGKKDRVPASTNGSRGAADEPGELAEQDQFDLLIDEIAALDLAHERGLLEDRKYEDLRADAKRRLQRLGAAGSGALR